VARISFLIYLQPLYSKRDVSWREAAAMQAFCEAFRLLGQSERGLGTSLASVFADDYA